jgi:hypothetical protein
LRRCEPHGLSRAHLVRRVLAVGEPDSEGGYPVLAIDVDGAPYAGLMYSVFDVYESKG